MMNRITKKAFIDGGFFSDESVKSEDRLEAAIRTLKIKTGSLNPVLSVCFYSAGSNVWQSVSLVLSAVSPVWLTT